MGSTVVAGSNCFPHVLVQPSSVSLGVWGVHAEVRKTGDGFVACNTEQMNG